MFRTSKKLAACALAVFATAAGTASAAAPPDVWVRWNTASPNHTVRSLDFLGPSLFASSDGAGIFHSASGTFVDWTQKNAGLDGAQSLSAWQVALNEAGDGNLYAATSAGLFRSIPPGDGWQPVGQGTGPRKLNMGGVQSIVFNGGGDMTVAVAGAAGPGVYYSADNGDTWDKASGMPAGENVYALTRGAPGTIWAAGDNGVWASPNNGRSWVALSDGISPGETTLRVAFVDGQRLYASTSSTVYKTSSGGLTWDEADGADGEILPAGGKRAFLMTPTLNGQFGDNRGVVGTERGPWATIDGGDHWLPMTDQTLADGYGDGVQSVRDSVVWALGLGFTEPGLLAGNGFGVFHLPLWPASFTTVTIGPFSPKPGDTLISQVNGQEGTKPYFFKYQWRRCQEQDADPNVTCTPTTPIPGATGPTYTVPNADGGKQVRYALYVEMKNLVAPDPDTGVSGATTTNGVGNVPGTAPRPTTNLAGKPSVSPKDSGPWDRTYTISNGSWGTEDTPNTPLATSFEYRWSRCKNAVCTPITGEEADDQSYTSTPDDIAYTLKPEIRGRRGQGVNEQTSDWYLAGDFIGLIQNKIPENEVLPEILGDPYVGVVLSSSAGGWDGHAMTYERTWLRCNAEGVQCNPTNPVQKGSTYELTAADKGSTLQLKVVATGADETFPRKAEASSAVSPVIGDPPVVPGGGGPGGGGPGGGPDGGGGPGGGTTQTKPKIKIKRPKKLKVGAKLSVPKAFAGFRSPKYQWLRNGKKIKKATKRTYKIVGADRRRKLSCRVTLTPAAGGAAVVAKSNTVKVPGKKKKRKG